MKMRCAIVTDEDSQMLELFRKLLSPWFERVYTTGLDHKVVKVAEVDPPDLIITNITRYGFNGLDLVEYWRGNPSTSNAAIWVVSGSMDANMVKVATSQADMFFEKPFNSKDITEHLQRLAESRLGEEDN